MLNDRSSILSLLETRRSGKPRELPRVAEPGAFLCRIDAARVGRSRFLDRRCIDHLALPSLKRATVTIKNHL